MEELLTVLLFIGDDWAEDHHDLEIEDETGRGWPRPACRRVWRESADYTHWSPNTPRRQGDLRHSVGTGATV